MAADVQPAPPAAPGVSFFSRVRPFTGVIALVVLCAVFGSREPAFFSSDNFLNILSVVSVVGILAVGQAFPLIGGGFDLSQGAIAGFTGAVVASLMSRYGFPIPAAIAGGLALGALLGCINGVLVAWVGINPFVATLGTQTAFTGLTLVYTNNQPQALGAQAATFRLINYGMIGPFKTASVLFLALIVLLAFVLKMLAYGQHLYTLGGNEEATRLAGIDTVRLKISTYVVSGTLAALASLVMIARAGQASPSEGRGTELESLASCIIGGIALGGGVGGAWNVLLGAITLGVITNGLQMLGKHGVSPYLQPVIRGVIILLAVAVDARARSRR
ncbi:MAG TPA: ABC transporter permease [Armatimonadota bacterium]|nr:ABC transporter permease [Armatimonadota bacterium]